MDWKKLFQWFAVVTAVVFGLVYLIITVIPIYGIACGIVVAACQSGNVWALFASQWILPILIGIFTSPLIVDYIRVRNALKSLKDGFRDDLDADR